MSAKDRQEENGRGKEAMREKRREKGEGGEWGGGMKKEREGEKKRKDG